MIEDILTNYETTNLYECFLNLGMKVNEKKVAIVTGSSSGIGFQTALLLARNGYSTYASMRNIAKSKTITEIAKKERLSLQTIQLDVNDDVTVKSAVDKIVKDDKRIDVLVNNAGYGLFGALEELSIDEIKAQFETNFFGMIPGNTGSSAHNEKSGWWWYDSQHKFSWRTSKCTNPICVQ